MAHRVHECVQRGVLAGQSQPQIANRLIEADIWIHKIIEDYERRGQVSSDAEVPEPPAGAPSPSEDGVVTDTERVRRGGYLW